MFAHATEQTLDKVYDWLDVTYYSPNPVWRERDNGPERRRNRLYAIHALNDMRALYAGVGNNGWWEEDRVLHLQELQDMSFYISSSMEEVLDTNEEIREFWNRHERAREEWENWDDEMDNEFTKNNAPDIITMQGNKDGKLYEYTKELFWDSVEWFINNFGWWQEKKALKEILETGKAEAVAPQRKKPKSAGKIS